MIILIFVFNIGGGWCEGTLVVVLKEKLWGEVFSFWFRGYGYVRQRLQICCQTFGA